ncbi:MAG: hypothetical protein R3F30_07985 [Planctomycetota bacterium]
MRALLELCAFAALAAGLPAQAGQPVRPEPAPEAAGQQPEADAKAAAAEAREAARAAAEAKAREAAARAAEAARKRLVRQLRVLAHKLVGPGEATSRKAKDEFQALVRGGELARLGYEAERAWFKARGFWKDYHRVHARDSFLGTIEVRAQQSRLLGMDTLTTSLGPAGQVRIQLPRTQSTSIGTTVTVPLGVGR